MLTERKIVSVEGQRSAGTPWNRVEFVCEQCGNVFCVRCACKTHIPKFCGNNCRGLSLVGKNKGPHSEETKTKISRGNKGKVISKRQIEILRKARVGHIPWNKGKKMWSTERPHPQGTLGMKFPNKLKFSDETLEKMRLSHLGKPGSVRGSKHHFWKGRVTTENEAARKSIEYKNWRCAVFERDKYTCVKCKDVGGKLHADHIQPFSVFPKLRYNVDNGQTLCIECHKETPTYGGRILNYVKSVEVGVTCLAQ